MKKLIVEEEQILLTYKKKVCAIFFAPWQKSVRKSSDIPLRRRGKPITTRHGCCFRPAPKQPRANLDNWPISSSAHARFLLLGRLGLDLALESYSFTFTDLHPDDNVKKLKLEYMRICELEGLPKSFTNVLKGHCSEKLAVHDNHYAAAKFLICSANVWVKI